MNTALFALAISAVSVMAGGAQTSVERVEGFSVIGQLAGRFIDGTWSGDTDFADPPFDQSFDLSFDLKTGLDPLDNLDSSTAITTHNYISE